MDSKQSLWDSCLQLIRQKINNERAYSTWFADIRCEHYDPQAGKLLLQVPSRYVFEYLEQYCVRLMCWALKETYGANVTLNYRIQTEPEFAQIAEYLRQQGYDTSGSIPHIQMSNAEERLRKGLRYCLGEDGYQWPRGYDDLASWLTDNKGRGLLIVGPPGLGKTLVCRKILPVFLTEKGIKFTYVTAQEMNSRIDELIKKQCVIIDDLGTEPVEVVYDYGKRRRPFYDLCDAAEQEGKLLIINTNLSTTPVSEQFRSRYPSSIQERYGNAVTDRLRAIVKSVQFAGKSMRR